MLQISMLTMFDNNSYLLEKL